MGAEGVTCPRCSADWPAGMKFCGSCGAPMEAPARAVEVRKTVTAVFCDVTGSTALGERLDPESLRALMESYFAAVSEVLTRHGGTVEKFVGDAVMAVFGVPVAHEDDALRACRAAMQMQAAVAAVDARVASSHGVRFAVRVGMETGEVLVGDASRGSTFASGAPVNMAARLEQAAGPGEALLGKGTYRLVRDVVDVEARPGLALKGFAGSVTAYLLHDVPERSGGDRPVRAPLVGRVGELALLRQALARASADRTCQLATVLGTAGVGKSRLIGEFVADCPPGVTVLRGRCLSYGEGASYWPLVETVRLAAGLSGAEAESEVRPRLAELVAGDPDAAQLAERLTALAGLGGVPGSVEESAWAVRRLLEILAAAGPVVWVVDDLHWAEPGLVEIVESACEWSRDAPILVVVLARPEFLDTHSSWGAGRVNGVTALLEPLRDDEVDRLTGELLGGALPREVAARVRAAAGGNPLFVEQLLGMLVEEGALRRDNDRWISTVDLTRLAVPPTIAALLGARLDLLTVGERAVLGPAAVMGQVFYRSAATELAGLPAAEVDGHLKALLRKGLIRPAATDPPGQEALRFAHALVRDAAYSTLPKAARADLHERFARWLDKHTSGPAYDDFIGEHLEQAYRNRADLGGLDDAAHALGHEAAARLAAAGRRVLYGDSAAAVALLDRAVGLRPEEGPERWACLVTLAEALTFASESTRAADAARQALAGAQSAGDGRWITVSDLRLAVLEQSSSPEGATEALRAKAQHAIVTFTPLGDHYVLSRAYEALSHVYNMSGRSGEQDRVLGLAAHHAAQAGQPERGDAMARWRIQATMFGDTPATVGLARSTEFLATAPDRRSKAMAAMAVGYFATLLGGSEQGETAKHQAERLADEMRSSILSAGLRMVLGTAELTAGSLEAALCLLTEGCRILEADRRLAQLSTMAALASHAFLHASRAADARSYLDLARRTGSSDDVLTQMLHAAGAAWLAAYDSDPNGVREHTAAAISRLSATDDLINRGIVCVGLAEAASLIGDLDGARQQRQAAIEMFQAKGAVAAAARQRALL